MKAFNRLNRILKDRSGNALAIGAAVMPLLLGASAMAIDSIQLGVWKRQLQRAADSSAIAGVHAMSQGKSYQDAVHRDLDRNYFPALSQPETVTPGPHSGYQQAVRVQLVAEQRLPFMSIFLESNPQIEAEATAALVQDGRFCVLSLYDGTQTGIDVGGNATINLGCGVASNSRSSQAVTASGSSLLTASPIMAVGGVESSNNFADGTALQPHSTRQSDPFSNLADPAPDPSQCGSPLRVAPQDTVDYSNAGPDLCFSVANIKGTVNFGSDKVITIYGGDLNFESQANVTCQRCTFVLTGPGGEAGVLDMNAQADVNLVAPSTGPYANVLFYRDRRAANEEIKINGGADALLQGALYFPTSDIRMNGNAGFEARCFQMVGRIMTFRGTGDIVNSCPGQPNNPGFGLSYVRLIG